jgi:hypothetical protein
MNHWNIDNSAEYQRDRMRRELKEIRLAEKAMRASRQTEEKTTKARGYRPGLVMRIILTTIKLLIP